jgi:hypothetical protein
VARVVIAIYSPAAIGIAGTLKWKKRNLPSRRSSYYYYDFKLILKQPKSASLCAKRDWEQGLQSVCQRSEYVNTAEKRFVWKKTRRIGAG